MTRIRGDTGEVGGAGGEEDGGGGLQGQELRDGLRGLALGHVLQVPTDPQFINSFMHRRHHWGPTAPATHHVCRSCVPAKHDEGDEERRGLKVEVGGEVGIEQVQHDAQHGVEVGR